MKIKLTFNDQTVIVKMEDNSAGRQFIERLPSVFHFTDFAGEEKISRFETPLSLNDAPRGMIAKAGKMFIYAPWGNFGFFYKDHGNTIDPSLIPLGEIESGLDALAAQTDSFSAKIELQAE